MNRIAKLSFIAALSALALGGDYHTAGAQPAWPAEIEQTVRDFNGNFNVVDISTLSEQSETRMWIKAATPEQLSGLHAAIEANKALADKWLS